MRKRRKRLASLWTLGKRESTARHPLCPVGDNAVFAGYIGSILNGLVSKGAASSENG